MATRKANATSNAAPSASYVDLKRQYDELEQRIADERAKLKPEVIAHIRASMVEYGIDVREIVNAKGNVPRKRRTRAELAADNAAAAQDE